MTNYVYVLLDDRSPNMDLLIRQLKPYCADDIETHSSAGVEIVSMILDIGQFALALIQLPYLYDIQSLKAENGDVLERYPSFSKEWTEEKNDALSILASKDNNDASDILASIARDLFFR